MSYGAGVDARRTGTFSYPDAGMTADRTSPPPGFHALRVRTRLGSGPALFAAAAEALLTWRMHRATPLGVTAGAARAAPGVRVTLRFGPVRAPCRVVWSVREPRRAGFAYGTLPGHPECGEESFLLTLGPDGAVDFTVTAFSRPAAWYTRAAGPLARTAQHLVARRYGAALRTLARRGAA
jgi:uncharacterized protein (UPF0548 family)